MADIPNRRGDASTATRPPAEPSEVESRALDRLAREVEKRVEDQARPEAPSQQAKLDHLRREQERLKSELARREAELSRHAAEIAGEADAGPPGGWLERLRRGIAKTRDSLTEGLSRAVLGRETGEPQLLTDLEDVLLAADVGPKTAARLMAGVRERLRGGRRGDGEGLRGILREEVLRMMARDYPPSAIDSPPGADGPVVVLFVGVNGSGKTTSIGKLAARYRKAGKRVLLVAGDTFRAAAAEQLAGWGDRTGSPVFQKPAGSDPSGVLYQALQQGMADKADLVLCDTAGRLHTKANLMEELKKMKRVLGKLLPDAPHETWLVVDGNNGQNALIQAREYRQALGITGLIVTKLDGTARGGAVIGIVNEFDLPIRYVGIGEAVDDLRPFDPRQFAESLFDADSGAA